ncbi:MAG: hypothetical protein ABSE86_15780 [Bryobacteraceae bacterium]|jgi:hypothetical protein
MEKKSQPHVWPEAEKLCRLNQDDITMAKRLGFRPDSLIRNRPDPKQKWKLPVKYWIREVHRERFGYVLREGPAIPATPPPPSEMRMPRPESSGPIVLCQSQLLRKYGTSRVDERADDREVPF